MDILKNKIAPWLRKFKYAIVILLIGIILMTVPVGKEKTTEKENITAEEDTSLQEELESILSDIEGVGTVSVLLSRQTGSETVYQTDKTDSSEKTVTVKSTSNESSGLIRQTIPETYAGALIVCQGAGDAAVRLSVADAVSKITGLGADKISIQIMN